MIKLICPQCGSDKIFYSDNDKDFKEDHFKCENCEREFTMQDTEWKAE